MVKLIVDARMLYSSGIGRYIREILKKITPYFDVLIIANSKGIEFAKENNIQYRLCNAPIYSFKEQFELAKFSDKKAIFWSPHYNIPIFPATWRYRIVTIHDVNHLALPEQFSFVKRLYAKFMFNSAVNKSDTIITVSNFSKNEIIKYTNYIPEKINVIYNGVEQKPILGDINLIKNKYALPNKYILYVGNVKPHKNLKLLLESYLLLNEEIKREYKIVIVGKYDGFITGDKELFSYINPVSELKNNIFFTGFVADEDMNTIYANASLFVFPSLYEGFGFPPLEAMACGCSTAVSNVASMPEVCGDASLYFNPLDVNDIADKMQMIIDNENLRQNLIVNGCERVKKFSWENAAKQHIELINECVEKL